MNTFQRRDINWNAIGKLSPISADVKAHLVVVYTTLSMAILSAAIGSIVYLTTHLGGSLTLLMSIGLLIWLMMTPKEQVSTRVSLLMAFAFVQGLSLGPLLMAVADIDPSIVSTAFFGTVCIFGCFSASAYFAERRSYLFLGGILGSALSMMTVMTLFNIFFRSSFAANIMLYGGLLIFSGYVCFDTQLIIEKASMGEKDFVGDTLELFIDFVAIFIRLLIILSKDKKRDNNNSNRR